MSWEDFYLVCFLVGLVLSFVSMLGGFAHLHLGHSHRAGLHIAKGGHVHAGQGHPGRGWAAINGFTVTAFLCWFGGAGYLMERFSGITVPLIVIAACGCGFVGAAILWAALFRFLLPKERVMTAEETEMAGVVAKVSDQIREGSGVGEIIFSQTGARRSSAARSEDGRGIERGAEVVVLRYERGVAWVRRWEDGG